MRDEQDELGAIASATEWTGMLPAVPPDGDSEPVRRMMRAHPQPRRIYRRKKH